MRIVRGSVCRLSRPLLDTRGDSLYARADPQQHSSRCKGRRFGFRQFEMFVSRQYWTGTVRRFLLCPFKRISHLSPHVCRGRSRFRLSPLIRSGNCREIEGGELEQQEQRRRAIMYLCLSLRCSCCLHEISSRQLPERILLLPERIFYLNNYRQQQATTESADRPDTLLFT